MRPAHCATASTSRSAPKRWGYKRFWLAEHHNMDGVASSATAVLIAYVAAGTKTIRVGSGGVMLPNHAPLVIAEQFGTLATLHPGRIDLGLGRAPGTDQLTARALRRHLNSNEEDDFARDVVELIAYLDALAAGSSGARHPGRRHAGAGVDPGLEPRMARSSRPTSACRMRSRRTSRPICWSRRSTSTARPTGPRRAGPSRTRWWASTWSRPTAMPRARGCSRRCSSAFSACGAACAARCRGRWTRWTACGTRPSAPACSACWPPPRAAGPTRSSASCRRIVERTGAKELIVAGAIHDHAARLRSYEILAGVAAA